MAPTQAPALPVAIAKKPSHKCTDAFQIVKRAQPDRNDLGYRAASGPRWSDIGGANVGATAFLLETPLPDIYVAMCRHPTPIDLKAPTGQYIRLRLIVLRLDHRLLLRPRHFTSADH